MSAKHLQTAATNARRLQSTIRRVEQQPYDFTSDRREPRVTATSQFGYCQLVSSLGPATGTWHNLTPTSLANVDIYGEPIADADPIDAAAKVYNYLKVTWATGKTTVVMRRGGKWHVLNQEC